MAIVAGCSDGMLIRHLWMTMVGEPCDMKVRSDSSAARAMVQRQGIGRVRHLDAALLWVQQKESEKIFNVGAIGTELNCADIGTKNLTRSRLYELLYMLKVVDSTGERIGLQEFKDLEYKERMRKATRKIMKVKDLRVGLLMIMSRLDEVAGTDLKEKEENYDWSTMWSLEHRRMVAVLHDGRLPGQGLALHAGEGDGHVEEENPRRKG